MTVVEDEVDEFHANWAFRKNSRGQFATFLETIYSEIMETLNSFSLRRATTQVGQHFIDR